MIYTQCHKEGCHFRVWAPERQAMHLALGGRHGSGGPPNGAPLAGSEHHAHRTPPADEDLLADEARLIAMHKDEFGYFHADVAGAGNGTRYQYLIDHAFYPDPASAFQPLGVYGPSEVIDHRLSVWSDASWHVPPFSELIFYELHVGTFTPEGTFDAIIPRLAELASIGINALELMPVAAFSGERGWGYDGAFLYAVHHSYGGPDGLRRLVDACHAQGIAVFLDVVYNHIGREGNCLATFGPYFTEQYHTPWGQAINYDSAWCDGVRAFIISNALYWAENFHIDGLRLDAIHEIYDRNAVTIWDDLYNEIDRWQQTSGRRLYLVAESDSNDPRVVRPPAAGGRGFDAQWMDDFHHAHYVLLDPDGAKNYRDFGSIEQVAKAWTQGFVHSGENVRFRHRRHGASSAGSPGHCFLVFNQNHDLPGNRPGAERLSRLVPPDTLKLAAAAVLLSPYIPLLFMGEEYGEDAPFYFFSDYQDPDTTKGLLEGRRQQFTAFSFEGKVRDPQDAALFSESKLRWEKRITGDHKKLLDWHRQLIHLRRTHPLLRDLSKRCLRADVIGTSGLSVYRYSENEHLVCLFNFSHTATIPFTLGYAAGAGYAAATGGSWRRLLGSGDDAIPASGTDPIPVGGTVHLPKQSVAVYALSPSPGSPAPAAG